MGSPRNEIVIFDDNIQVPLFNTVTSNYSTQHEYLSSDFEFLLIFAYGY